MSEPRSPRACPSRNRKISAAVGGPYVPSCVKTRTGPRYGRKQAVELTHLGSRAAERSPHAARAPHHGHRTLRWRRSHA